MGLVNKFTVSAALAAAGAMVAAPLAAAELPIPARATVATSWNADAVNAQDHRWRRYRHHDGLDGGDVLAGVLVLGGIAAIASAASHADRDRDYRYPDARYPQRPYDSRYRSVPSDPRYDDSRGIVRAVDMCVREVERTRQVDRVDQVSREADGWRIAGVADGGGAFTCRFDAQGRMSGVDFGGISLDNDRQWNDDRYAAARAAQDGSATPAYPGGPLPGDD
jgi:hypothetical protein